MMFETFKRPFLANLKSLSMYTPSPCRCKRCPRTSHIAIASKHVERAVTALREAVIRSRQRRRAARGCSEVRPGWLCRVQPTQISQKPACAAENGNIESSEGTALTVLHNQSQLLGTRTIARDSDWEKKQPCAHRNYMATTRRNPPSLA